MNREIKFRAWDKDAKIMYQVEVFNLREGFVSNEKYLGEMINVGSILECHTHCLPISDVELMQYTGLKDKNGKEIYSGDLLKIEGKPSMCEVFYETPSFKIKGDFEGSYILSRLDSHIRYDVIGNVWENPDLLEKTK